MKSIYLIGSLRNEKIPEVANEIEAEGFEVFDDWFSPGPEADDYWRKYEKARGRSYREALNGYAGGHIFEFDKHHINRCDIGVLVMPAGKSGHLELGYILGQKKPGYIVFEEEPERWDIMYQFATAICFSMDELKSELAKLKLPTDLESDRLIIDISTDCPECGGPADNGFDRCVPPNPYLCTRCSEE